MKLPTVILIICAIYLLGFFSHSVFLQKTVYGDGRYYYSWLRSLTFDHTIDFRNEFAHFGITEPLTAKGLPRNKYSIGPALLWAPLYLYVRTILLGNGWSLPYQLTVGLTSVLSALFGLVLLLRITKKPPPVAALSILLIAGATNLLFYGSVDTVNSHALSFFAASSYLAFLLSPSIESFAAGFMLGILASIRLQDMVFILLALPHRKHIGWPSFIGGLCMALIPQALAWYALYGSLVNPYLSGGETFDFTHPHILGVLFSTNNGLILWTPIVAVGLFGLIRSWRKYWAYIAVFSAELLMVSSWGTWWQGASVSGRMFVSSLPLIAVGLSDVITLLYSNRLIRNVLPIFVWSLCYINALGIIYYLLIH